MINQDFVIYLILYFCIYHMFKSEHALSHFVSLWNGTAGAALHDSKITVYILTRSSLQFCLHTKWTDASLRCADWQCYSCAPLDQRVCLASAAWPLL